MQRSAAIHHDSSAQKDSTYTGVTDSPYVVVIVGDATLSPNEDSSRITPSTESRFISDGYMSPILLCSRMVFLAQKNGLPWAHFPIHFPFQWAMC
ncbi:hypothetical protein AVEN_8986-1 [Araneus ventricosus]|uniref:Uncharacterized protein n=1 Tax=Araneus ventricosus TaxID=182803 RepID=A0A4Y2P793_ARAVE|nr:hypothetical protein AVEN_8986-1 [Araneus ventricosus]